MRKYIHQLLSDITSSHHFNEVNVDSSEACFDIGEVDQYLNFVTEEPLLPFSDYCNLNSSSFPPSNMLDNVCITELCTALQKMYLSWNISPDLPENLPINQTYQFLTSILDMKITPKDNAMIGIEFCEYVVEDCPFGEEHCNCKVWQEEIRDNLEIQIQEVLEGINEFIDNQGHEEYLYINYNGAEQFKRYKMPLKPIGECIGLDIFNIPSAYELDLAQINLILHTFLKAWHPDDAMHLLFKDEDPIKRYEIWQEFIHCLAWFDGLSEIIISPDNLKEMMDNSTINLKGIMLMDDDENSDI